MGQSACKTRGHQLHKPQSDRGAIRLDLYIRDKGFMCHLRLGSSNTRVFLLDTGFSGMPILNNTRNPPPNGCVHAKEAYEFAIASIGRVEQYTAEQIDCPVHISGHGSSSQSRRFLLMDMDQTPDILTVDFLLSWGSCVSLELGGSSPHVTVGEFKPQLGGVEVPTRNVNGAYAIRLSILNAEGVFLEDGWFIIDTGSPAPLTTGRRFGERLKHHEGIGQDIPKRRFVKQIGVNRETICSLVSSNVIARVGTIEMSTPLLLNDIEIPGGVDGYIGLGMLIPWGAVQLRRQEGGGGVRCHINLPHTPNRLHADTSLIEDAMRDSC